MDHRPMTAADFPPIIASASGNLNFPAIDHTVAIVAAYVGHNAVSRQELPELIANVYTAVNGMMSPAPIEEAPTPQEPAVPIKRSVTPDAIICLEDGKKFKSLKRHLRTQYNLSPEQYRAKWGLPADYPMVAPNYSAQRSSLAKKSGFGLKR